MLLTSAILLLLDHALASPIEAPLEKRQCPGIHVFGARETTAAAGYGSSITVVDGVLADHSGATSEAINYPACGGQSSCGGDSYSQSVAAGVSAVVTAVNNYAAECPSTQLVLVGYSQACIGTITMVVVQANSARALRYSTLPFVVVVIQTKALQIPPCYLAQQLLTISRLLSSWATLYTIMVFLTMLEHAQLVA